MTAACCSLLCGVASVSAVGDRDERRGVDSTYSCTSRHASSERLLTSELSLSRRTNTSWWLMCALSAPQK